ncbi:hypothetical protein BH20ACI2_BH20ACI2_25970 [soil metagenome]
MINSDNLRVSLPRREETKARKIEVTGRDAGQKTIQAMDQSKTAGVRIKK